MDKDLRTATSSASLNSVDTSAVVDKHPKEETNKRGDINSKEAEAEKAKSAGQPKKSESPVKEPTVAKSSTKKSSRFFSASYFSSGDEAEFAPSTVFSGLATLVREQLPKVVVGMVLVLAGYYFTIPGKLPKLMCTACCILTFFPLSRISPYFLCLSSTELDHFQVSSHFYLFLMLDG